MGIDIRLSSAAKWCSLQGERLEAKAVATTGWILAVAYPRLHFSPQSILGDLNAKRWQPDKTCLVSLEPVKLPRRAIPIVGKSPGERPDL